VIKFYCNVTIIVAVAREIFSSWNNIFKLVSSSSNVIQVTAIDEFSIEKRDFE